MGGRERREAEKEGCVRDRPPRGEVQAGEIKATLYAKLTSMAFATIGKDRERVNSSPPVYITVCLPMSTLLNITNASPPSPYTVL